jgi:hypothetical protein
MRKVFDMIGKKLCAYIYAGGVLGECERVEFVSTESGVDVGGLFSPLGVLLQQENHAPQVVGPGGHVQRRVGALVAVALDHGRPSDRKHTHLSIAELVVLHIFITLR